MPLLTPIRGLRSFCIAAKCLSFKQAANQLCLSPSAVSHQIKQLEEQLEIELFVRKTRAIELTLVGKKFYEAINPKITQLESTITEFTNRQENITITISLPEFLASEVFVPRLSEWTEINSAINLRLETVKADQPMTKLCDLSIVLSNTTPMAEVIYELFPICYVVACNKKLYERWKKLGFDALNSVPLILHQARPWAWHQWADRTLVENFEPSQIIQLDSMYGVARAAQKGMGIALIPMPISHQWFTDQLLFKLYPNKLETNDRYFLVQNETKLNQKKISQFAGWVKSTFQTLE